MRKTDVELLRDARLLIERSHKGVAEAHEMATKSRSLIDHSLRRLEVARQLEAYLKGTSVTTDAPAGAAGGGEAINPSSNQNFLGICGQNSG